MFELMTCVAVDKDGSDCRASAMPDAPLPICARHMRLAFLFYADLLERTPAAADDLDARRIPDGFYADADPRESYVYYVLIGSHVKIGTTINMATRMATLQPDQILAVEVGGRDLERRRHAQFAKWLAKGREYFWPGPDLRAHLEGLRDTDACRLWAG